MKARAICYVEPGRVELRRVEIPEPGEGQILTRTRTTSVSPGTELRCLAGTQDGIAFPAVAGYSNVGLVEHLGPGVDRFAVGDRVFHTGSVDCGMERSWGGHVEYAVVNTASATPVPESVPDAAAALTKLAAIALRGVRLSRVEPGTNVAVVGLGPIGQLSARLFRLHGANVVGFDLDESRVETLRQSGCPATLVESDLPEAVARWFEGGADVVVDSTGIASVLPQSMLATRRKPWDESVAPGSTLVIQGSYAEDFSLPYQESFLRELRILMPRDAQLRDFRAVLGLMADGRLSAEGLVTRVLPVERAPEAYDLLQRREGMTYAFDWQGAGAP